MGENSPLPSTSFGNVAEWVKAAVLKTVESKGSVGSNPTISANLCASFYQRTVMRLHLDQKEVLKMIANGVTQHLHLGGGRDFDITVTLRLEEPEKSTMKEGTFSAEVIWEYPKE